MQQLSVYWHSTTTRILVTSITAVVISSPTVASAVQSWILEQDLNRIKTAKLRIAFEQHFPVSGFDFVILAK
jgi:hypothetical protein